MLPVQRCQFFWLAATTQQITDLGFSAHLICWLIFRRLRFRIMFCDTRWCSFDRAKALTNRHDKVITTVVVIKTLEMYCDDRVKLWQVGEVECLVWMLDAEMQILTLTRTPIRKFGCGGSKIIHFLHSCFPFIARIANKKHMYSWCS